jgi:drug/metabolite transporter (DMT)-like permease
MREAKESGSASGVGLIVTTLLAWSSVPLFLRYFTAYVDAWTTNGFRYGISALIWTPWLIIQYRRNKLPAGLWRAALFPSAVNIAGQCCFAWAPYYIQPGLLTFMLRLQIIFVTIGAYLLFPHERSTLRRPVYWTALAVVFCGSVGTILFGEAGLPRGGTAFGVALGICAGMFFGAYSLSVRYFLHDVHPITAFAAIGHYTAAGLIAVMLLASDDHGAGALHMHPARFLLLLASGLIGIGFSHAAYYAAMARLGVAVAAGVILLQPFITGSMSMVIFKERLNGMQWASGVIAMTGAAVMLWTQHQTRRRASAEPAHVPPEAAEARMGQVTS